MKAIVTPGPRPIADPGALIAVEAPSPGVRLSLSLIHI